MVQSRAHFGQIFTIVEIWPESQITCSSTSCLSTETSSPVAELTWGANPAAWFQEAQIGSIEAELGVSDLGGLIFVFLYSGLC